MSDEKRPIDWTSCSWELLQMALDFRAKALSRTRGSRAARQGLVPFAELEAMSRPCRTELVRAAEENKGSWEWPFAPLLRRLLERACWVCLGSLEWSGPQWQPQWLYFLPRERSPTPGGEEGENRDAGLRVFLNSCAVFTFSEGFSRLSDRFLCLSYPLLDSLDTDRLGIPLAIDLEPGDDEDIPDECSQTQLLPALLFDWSQLWGTAKEGAKQRVAFLRESLTDRGGIDRWIGFVGAASKQASSPAGGGLAKFLDENESAKLKEVYLGYARLLEECFKGWKEEDLRAALCYNRPGVGWQLRKRSLERLRPKLDEVGMPRRLAHYLAFLADSSLGQAAQGQEVQARQILTVPAWVVTRDASHDIRGRSAALIICFDRQKEKLRKDEIIPLISAFRLGSANFPREEGGLLATRDERQKFAHRSYKLALSLYDMLAEEVGDATILATAFGLVESIEPYTGKDYEPASEFPHVGDEPLKMYARVAAGYALNHCFIGRRPDSVRRAAVQLNAHSDDPPESLLEALGWKEPSLDERMKPGIRSKAFGVMAIHCLGQAFYHTFRLKAEGDVIPDGWRFLDLQLQPQNRLAVHIFNPGGPLLSGEVSRDQEELRDLARYFKVEDMRGPELDPSRARWEIAFVIPLDPLVRVRP